MAMDLDDLVLLPRQTDRRVILEGNQNGAKPVYLVDQNGDPLIFGADGTPQAPDPRITSMEASLAAIQALLANRLPANIAAHQNATLQALTGILQSTTTLSDIKSVVESILDTLRDDEVDPNDPAPSFFRLDSGATNSSGFTIAPISGHLAFPLGRAGEITQVSCSNTYTFNLYAQIVTGSAASVLSAPIISEQLLSPVDNSDFSPLMLPTTAPLWVRFSQSHRSYEAVSGEGFITAEVVMA